MEFPLPTAKSASCSLNQSEDCLLVCKSKNILVGGGFFCCFCHGFGLLGTCCVLETLEDNKFSELLHTRPHIKYKIDKVFPYGADGAFNVTSCFALKIHQNNYAFHNNALKINEEIRCLFDHPGYTDGRTKLGRGLYYAPQEGKFCAKLKPFFSYIGSAKHDKICNH